MPPEFNDPRKHIEVTNCPYCWQLVRFTVNTTTKRWSAYHEDARGHLELHATDGSCKGRRIAQLEQRRERELYAAA